MGSRVGAIVESRNPSFRLKEPKGDGDMQIASTRIFGCIEICVNSKDFQLLILKVLVYNAQKMHIVNACERQEVSKLIILMYNINFISFSGSNKKKIYTKIYF